MVRRPIATTGIKNAISIGGNACGMRTTIPCACVLIMDQEFDYVEWVNIGNAYSIRPSKGGPGSIKVQKNKNAHRITIPKTVGQNMGMKIGGTLGWFVSCDGNKWDIQVEVVA